MIVRNIEWDLGYMTIDAGYCSNVDVYVSDRSRISTVLGPDGEPLIFTPESNFGFDLTPR